MANNDSIVIKRIILDLLVNEHLRLTPIHLERVVCRTLPTTNKRAVRAVVKELLSSGRLIYTQHFSTTHLEINYNRPNRISPRIILSPSNCKEHSDPQQIVIRLNAGSSFGGGDHPTTRLMLQGLDAILGKNHHFCRGMDIGTGSGILAIAAAALGVDRVEGIDIDRVACHEAIQNVGLNGLEKSIRISSLYLESFSENQFDLVLANLRPPTIRQLIPEMKRVSSSDAVWLISGCRPDEKNNLEKLLNSGSAEVIWQAVQNSWAAFAVKLRFELK